MKQMANMSQVYITPGGRPTGALQQLLQDYERRLDDLEAKLAAVAAIAAPTGGATTDAEARAAIAALIAAAG